MIRISAILPAAILAGSIVAAGAVDDGRKRAESATRPTIDPNQVSITLESVVTGLERPVAVRVAGDVSQSRWEEIDFEPWTDGGGRDYGWNTMEGRHCFQSVNCSTDGLVLPIAEYSHSSGCSVAGGYVYRGSRSPALRGLYLFGDFCTGTVWGIAPDGSEGRAVAVVGETGASISSFGEDEDGELYLTDLASGTVFMITGRAQSPAPRRTSGRVTPGP